MLPFRFLASIRMQAWMGLPVTNLCAKCCGATASWMLFFKYLYQKETSLKTKTYCSTSSNQTWTTFIANHGPLWLHLLFLHAMCVVHFTHHSQRTKRCQALSTFTFYSLELFDHGKKSYLWKLMREMCVNLFFLVFRPIHCWLCKHDTDCWDFNKKRKTDALWTKKESTNKNKVPKEKSHKDIKRKVPAERWERKARDEDIKTRVSWKEKL